MVNDKENITRKKLDFYLGTDKVLHILLKTKRFYNARIISKTNDDVYLIEDRKLGMLEIFVSEIYDILLYREKSE